MGCPLCSLIRKADMCKKELELLAPAGSFEILKAVINVGADAVYIGGTMFGARAYADNFSREELSEALDYAHLREKKVYLTVNTLLKNEEIQDLLYDYLLPFYERGLDAVLVQDMGALKFIRRAFPDLPVHASTQMTITGVEGVKLLQSLGVARVVMAREVSIDEMKRIHMETGMELEAFVHGALCYCYSGQCLFSSMLGGRSGNRGRCAQPCRLSYTVLGENGHKTADNCFALSMKDLCGIEDIPALNQAGVYSLKIEGRMKQAAYAAGIVSYYRRYIDQYLSTNEEKLLLTKEDQQAIMDLGNRCGFTDSYYHRQNGKEMITFSRPNYATKNKELQRDILKDTANASAKIQICGHGSFHKGKPAELEVLLWKEAERQSLIDTGLDTSGRLLADVIIKAQGSVVEAAQRAPVSAGELRKRLLKTGDTPFEFTELSMEAEPDIFLPNGAVNQLRRDALDALKKELLKKYQRESSICQRPSLNNIPKKAKERELYWIAAVSSRQQLEAVLANSGIHAVYLETITYQKEELILKLQQDVQDICKTKKDVYLALPVIFRNASADSYERLAADFRNLPIKGFLVRNYEELGWVRRHFCGYEIIIDHNMYTYNDYAVLAFSELGVTRNTVPLELNHKEIRHRANADSEMILYGYYPLMVSAQCVQRNTAGCVRNSVITYLRDRYKAEFPVVNYCSECVNVIYNSLPTMLILDLDRLCNAGISAFRLNFTIETGKETADILERLTASLAGGEKLETTRGHFQRGVE